MKYFLLILLTGFLNTTFGQRIKTDSVIVTLGKIDIGPQGIGISYEPKLSNKLTADLCMGLGGSYGIAKDDFNYDVLKPGLYFSVTPNISTICRKE